MLDETARLTVRRPTARALLVVGVSLLGTLGIAGPASAAAPVPVTMAEEVDFNSGVFTFTATEGPLCASGTFVDDVKVAAFPHSEQARSGGFNLLIRSTYTCDDGSGTWEELKHLQLTFTETGFTNAGPVEILGGTGAYAGITGHGFSSGASDDESGTGAGTTTVVVQLP